VRLSDDGRPGKGSTVSLTMKPLASLGVYNINQLRSEAQPLKNIFIYFLVVVATYPLSPPSHEVDGGGDKKSTPGS
jgi:hypothetical protein